jgi:L-malate glycosyltransferase
MTLPSSRSVLYILDGSVDVTGAFVCARNMARALAGSAEVVLVLPKHSRIGPSELREFAAVHYLPLANLGRSLAAVSLYFPLLLLASWRLRLLMRRDGAARLVLNDFYFLHGLVCRVLGFRGRIFTWIRIDPRAYGRTLSRLWLRLLALSSERLVVVSQHLRTCLPNGLRTHLLYDTLDRPPLASDSTRAAGETRLVFVGNYIPGKGQDAAIEAFARVAGDFPDLTLSFHGSDMGRASNRSYLQQLRARAASTALGARLRFHDFAPDPREVLRGAFAALNFSACESFSMTVLEASGSGLPVIATRSGGPAEIIEDGVTGMLVDVGDVESMAAAIRSLVSNPALAAAMGRAGRARIAERFSPTAFRSGLCSVLDLPLELGR